MSDESITPITKKVRYLLVLDKYGKVLGVWEFMITPLIGGRGENSHRWIYFKISKYRV